MEPQKMTEDGKSPIARERLSKGEKIALWCISIAIVLPGAYGFTDKFIQFLRTLRSEEGGHFTLIPIMNYLLVTAGFVCLLIWAAARGMFRDIEEPKYTMLEREAELDRIEMENTSE